jgi:hypothetical protein
MKHKIVAQLDFDAIGCRKATNQGLPLLMAEPKHPLSEQLVALAQEEVALLEPQPEAAAVEESAPSRPEPKRRTGLFGRLKR